MPDQEQQHWLGLSFTSSWHLPEHLQSLSLTTNWPFVPSIFGIGWLVGWCFSISLHKYKRSSRALFSFTGQVWKEVLPGISHSICLSAKENVELRAIWLCQSETCKSSELKQQRAELLAQREDWQTDLEIWCGLCNLTYLSSNYSAPSQQYFAP